ncbi:MAG: deoxyribodipyrimidine photo-lyase [Alphaproteobacteria bacterium]|nr:deoxyribodipyrimidine photo-lyase [Alphaproteobacteria bacterium]
MSSFITLFWFRQDFRISDNPGLFEAAQNGAILPVYILDETCPAQFKQGEASKWWMYHSLHKLNICLNSTLNFYVGDPQVILTNIIQENDVKAVYWNKVFEPWQLEKDAQIESNLKKRGIVCKSFNGSLLWEPESNFSKNGTPYRMFTPFYRNGCLQAPSPRKPLPIPEKIISLKDQGCRTTLEDLKLLPSISWYKSIEHFWEIGEQAAQRQLAKFLEFGLKGYKKNRNYPSKDATSRLSPYLHFGEISPHQVWQGIQVKCAADESIINEDKESFLSEIGWREFSYYLLYHFPNLPYKSFYKKFEDFPWKPNTEFLKAWQKGLTGYPFVDAGMRELWQTGYMHNRVRMVVASFLVKNLLQDWRTGASWFLDCLLDADIASNTINWQWVAGSGVDAAPYFRIFNPILQGEKFDPKGIYTRRFVPELDKLPDKYLFKPWQTPDYILKECNIILGVTYPYPIINLQHSRKESIEAYNKISL